MLLLTICVSGRTAEAQTSIYIFGSDQSSVVKTGGFVGLQKTYSIGGWFRLTVDLDGGTASFEQVDATLTDKAGSVYGRSLNEIFNMTGLYSTVIDDKTITFKGKAADGTESDVRLKLSFREDSAYLTGKTTPPPNSADMFFYDIDSIAIKKYAGGTGEPNDPYQIATAADLIALGEDPNDYDKHFILTADIDLDPNLPGRKVFDKAVIAPDMNDANWEFDGTSFTGVFDGNGHTVSRLAITGGRYLGLFGGLGEWNINADVRHLGLVDVNIAGGDYLGALAGISYSASVVAQCYSTGAVSGKGYIGGLVGDNHGTVTQCYSTAAVFGAGTSQGYDGGIGGLVGENFGTLADCYSIGPVRCDCPYSFVHGRTPVGGLVGINRMILNSWGIVTNCFWDIQTSGQTMSYGGTGKTTDEMQTASTFFTWGTCGNDGAWTIDDCNDYPRLWWENKPGGPIRVAPLSDLLTGTGTENEPFLIYTADELNLIGLFSCEWDKRFKLMADIDISGFDGKDGKPPFNIIAPGHVDGPEMQLFFRGTPFTGLFDGNGHTISRLTVKTYECGGLFGGLGTTGEVRNLGVVDVNIVGSVSVGGLVGFSESSSSVTQCYSTGVVSGSSHIGGLVGYNGGDVTHCYSTCMVSGYVVGGGLVGFNKHGGNVTQCYSNGPVSGELGVGGLVGVNGGDVTQCYSTCIVSGQHNVGGLVGGNEWDSSVNQCYSTGPVSGESFLGGLAGYNAGAVNHCYSISAVSDSGKYVGGLVGLKLDGPDDPVIESFWDIQTSGQTNSAGGTGKTTAEMQTAGTFLDAGWDFVDETENGTEDIWWILEGQDYPRLWWELGDGTSP